MQSLNDYVHNIWITTECSGKIVNLLSGICSICEIYHRMINDFANRLWERTEQYLQACW